MAYLYEVTARRLDPVTNYRLFFTLPVRIKDPETALTHLYEGAEFFQSDFDPEGYEIAGDIRPHLYQVKTVVEICRATEDILKHHKII